MLSIKNQLKKLNSMLNLFSRPLFIIILTIFLLQSGFYLFQKTKSNQSTSNNYISLNYEKIYGIFQFYVYLGKPRQNFLISLNMSNNFTFITYYLYQKYKSTTIQVLDNNTCFTLVSNFNNLTVPSLLVSDIMSIDTIKEENEDSISSFSLPSFSIDKFMFYYPQINVPIDIGYDSIGSGFFYNNVSFSLVHLFYQNNLISQISFGFIPKSFSQGILYFGKLPHTLKTVKHNYKHILPIVNTRLTEWNVKLKGINYGKHPKNSNNNLVYFDSGETFICVPFNFIQYLKEEYFSSYIQERKCEYISSEIDSSQYFHCKCKDIKDFKSLVFNFENNINIELTRKELFEKDMSSCFFILRYCYNKNNQSFVFGSSFLGLFPTEFNYDMQSVIIYNDIKFHKNFYKDANVNPLNYYCYWTLCYLNIFGVMINIILIIINKTY